MNKQKFDQWYSENRETILTEQKKAGKSTRPSYESSYPQLLAGIVVCILLVPLLYLIAVAPELLIAPFK